MTEPRAPLWRHYTEAPGPLVPRFAMQHNLFKPEGLWLSDDAQPQNWPAYLAYATGDTLKRHRRYDVYLRPGANLLHLATEDELRRFSRRYALIGAGPLESTLAMQGYCLLIDWPIVAGEHDGILITPYQRNCRNDKDTYWYHTWDIATGCIWNPDAIACTRQS